MKDNMPVIIYPYNPLWPCFYEKELQVIEKTIGVQLLSIEHVGSTSVPGLCGKNIIDILAGVADMDAADRCRRMLFPVGYDDISAGSHAEWFYCLGKRLEGSYCHLHLVKEGSDHQERHTVFRDWLRDHNEDARTYAELKASLAKKYRNDRPRYTDAKGEFIARILVKAAAENGMDTDHTAGNKSR